jgi:hypothetical protein
MQALNVTDPQPIHILKSAVDACVALKWGAAHGGAASVARYHNLLSAP